MLKTRAFLDETCLNSRVALPGDPAFLDLRYRNIFKLEKMMEEMGDSKISRPVCGKTLLFKMQRREQDQTPRPLNNDVILAR